MLAKRFALLLLHPNVSFEEADKEPAKPLEIVVLTALLALIPAICGYVATVHIGWDLGAGSLFTLDANKAMYISIAAFVTFNVGVYAMGFGICWLSTTFDVKPEPSNCIEMAFFTAVPLFLTGFAALYPVLHINLLVGLLAVVASVYLLYSGLPIIMRIPVEKGFVYSTWIVSLGLIMLIVFLGISVFVFSALS